MNLYYSKLKQINGWLHTATAKKLGLWLVLSLVFSVIFLRSFWVRLPVLLSFSYIFDFHAMSWLVLAMCLIFLFLKRHEIDLNSDFLPRSTRAGFLAVFTRWIPGAILLASSVLIPASDYFLTFKVLLEALGIFIIIFGPGARIPLVLTAVYGFSIVFPLLIEYFGEDAYARLVFIPLMNILRLFNLPIFNQGPDISFTSTGGEHIGVAFTVTCAGPATMAVFLAIYALMMLDNPLPPKKAIWMFLFGIAGTWFQNLLRSFLVLVLGYYFGSSALWSAHYWGTYILFPLWYLIFALIYFRLKPGRSQQKT